MTTTDDIKARIELVSYVERYVPNLKKAGRYYKTCCPFHDDKTPSFVINPEKGTWRCYGACAEGGDLFSFAQKQHGWDFKEALKELAAEAGVELPQPQSKPSNAKTQRQLDLLSDLCTRYHSVLLEYDGAESVRQYLYERGITQESIEAWWIGYAPAHNIIPKLLQKHAADDLIELGIAYQHESGQLRSRFWNRLMIPIMDRVGQVVGFGARQLDHGQSAKYVNSHDSDIFTKSDLLYGFHLARKPAKWDNQIVIVEGYMDAIQAHQAGYTNVVAQMGTALTEKQIQLITDDNIQSIIVCLDGDDAGAEATDRAIDNLIAHAQTRDIRIVELPNGKDPDVVIQAGQWESAIGNAVPVIDYLINRKTGNLPDNLSLGQRHDIANQLIPKLYKLDDDTARLWSIQQLALNLNLNAIALSDMARQLMQAKSTVEVILEEPGERHPDAVAHPIEAYVVACLIMHPEWYWDLIGAFSKFNLPILSRTDFQKWGDTYQMCVDAIEAVTNVLNMPEIDIATLTDLDSDQHALILNALRLRLNNIQNTMNELAELREIEQFSHFLTQRTQIHQFLSELA